MALALVLCPAMDLAQTFFLVPREREKEIQRERARERERERKGVADTNLDQICVRCGRCREREREGVADTNLVQICVQTTNFESLKV